MRVIGFAIILAVGLSLAPLVVEAQHAGTVYRIGYLSPRPGIETQEETLRQALRALGYVEGQNLVIEWRFAKGNIETFPSLAAEIVRLKVDCILANGVGATRAAKQATATIPIVMVGAGDDPVRRGLVAGLARPGGNVTGIISLSEQLAGKRLQLLKEVVPHASRVAVVWPPFDGGPSPELLGTQAAGRELGVQLQSLEVRDSDGLEAAFRSVGEGRAEALIIVVTGFMQSHRARVLNLVAKTRLPAVYAAAPAWVLDGGLMSYSPNIPELYQRAATYVDKILKGATPADLPVEQPTKFELVINLKTAKTLGLTIPQSVLLRADQMIE
jgi:putative ABC transport system substrate-binding protein